MDLFKNERWIEAKERLQSLWTKKSRPTPLSRIETYLNENEVSYRRLPHPEAYSAMALAESLHVTGKRVAKVVVLRASRRYIMAVLPSHLYIDLRRLARLVKVDHVSLATEAELATLFPDCEAGTMPPLGNLYGLPVYVDLSLTREPLFFFQAGTRHDVIEIRYRDFSDLVRPEVGSFTAVPMGWVVAV
jgi:Ala-tRNA(Pro) deacylase